MSEAITRRTVLKGLGTAIALPWLEAMSPARGAAAGQASPAPGKPEGSPLRMAFFYVPNGMHMPDWRPANEGPLGELPPILKPLEAVKGEITVLSGLTLNGGRALGDGPGDHARAVASFLTTAHPYKTGGKDIRNGVSVDQVAAARVGHKTRFASLELGSEPSSQGGNCDSGYSCVYTSNMSWRTPTSPMAKEINPRAVFDRLFGSGDATEAAARAKRDRQRKSVLDLAAEDAAALRGRLGGADQQKLDEYLFAVREIERRMAESEKLAGREAEAPDFPRPEGVPREFGDHVKLMMDLIVLAWQTDSTRIATCMFTNAGSNRSYPNIDVRSGHHELSHHGRDAKKQAQISKINQYHAGLLAHFLQKLKSTREGDRSLLDSAMVMYGSGISDGDRHNHDDLPILLAGHGGGTVRPGRHLRYPDDTPLGNLYLAMLQRMGVEDKSFGDSKGPLEGLG